MFPILNNASCQPAFSSTACIRTVGRRRIRSFPSGVQVVIRVMSFPSDLPMFRMLQELDHKLFVQVIRKSTISFA